MKNSKNAFTLIEALISVAITAIGFAGVYGLVATSNVIMSETIAKEKLKFQNSEIIESLSADKANILEYNDQTLGLTTCQLIQTGNGMDAQRNRLMNWCQKVNGQVGNMRGNSTRRIQVVEQARGQNSFFVVSLEMSGKSDKAVYMKRVFYAP